MDLGIIQFHPFPSKGRACLALPVPAYRTGTHSTAVLLVYTEFVKKSSVQ
tara:strand:+ start:569 stop:718 length:150 start_codon:yes stop_codon:yes gene_type:complete